MTPGKSDKSLKHPSSDSEGRNLGDLLGLPPSKDCKMPKISVHSFISEEDIPRKIIQTKGYPLWMTVPENYPRVLETFRALKNSIILFNENKKFKIFTFSAAEAKAGASTVAFNLALVLSRDLPEKRILFIDTNVINPFLNKICEYSKDPCLMDYLLKKVPLCDIILPSFIPNLNLVFSSKIKDHEVAPFNIEVFVEFLDQIKQNYDFILLDSAPALMSSQTRSIAAKTDGVIMVAEANRTRREVISEFQRCMKEDNSNLIGSFLNKRRFFIPKWLYRFI